jgi:hypothetical protein
MSIVHRRNHAANVARTGRAAVSRDGLAGRLAGAAVAAALLLGAPILATVTATPASADTFCNPFTQVCLPNPNAPLGPWVPWAPQKTAPPVEETPPPLDGSGNTAPNNTGLDGSGNTAPNNTGLDGSGNTAPNYTGLDGSGNTAPNNNQPVPGTMFIPDSN